MHFTSISDLISDPGRSRHREYLLTTQFVRDAVFAAGKAGYDLLVYLPTVDSDGFDVILDDRYHLMPLQLKSSIEGGKVNGWAVHKTLLRPDPDDADLYGLDPDAAERGRAGGVVLIRAAVVQGELAVRYAYSDIDVLAAMWYEVWPLPVAQRKRVDRIRDELSDSATDKIVLPRSAFLLVDTPSQLLALAGLTSALEENWRSTLRMALRSRNRAIPYGDLDPAKTNYARFEIERLVAASSLRREPRTNRERLRKLVNEGNQALYRMEVLANEIKEGERKLSRRVKPENAG
jgi:hypothetical protein